ncbi:MAG TPA: ABC transporter permease [Candidatus Dormibacteraeota bacterium]|nr:ABC transporter permease [Candidatus Dormibacteraeota bacterium]
MAQSAVAAQPSRRGGVNFGRAVRRYGWTFAVYALFVLLMIVTVIIKPDYGPFEWNTLTLAALPLAFAAVAQTVVVLSGGIDLSVGPLMALANVLALRAMLGHDLRYSLGAAALVLLVVTLAGAVNGATIVLTRVPDIVVTLATSFIWAGLALLVLARPTPGIPFDFQNLAQGSALSPWIPNALLLLLVIPLVWVPLRRSRPGLSIYAVGSDRNAAFRSGVNLAVSRILAYAVCGFFAACGGLALSMTTGVGSPLAGTLYTLSGVSAIVLGGVSLAGGRGGMLGPIAAAYILSLIPAVLIYLGIDPNYGQMIQGLLIVLVVMIGGLGVVLRRP